MIRRYMVSVLCVCALFRQCIEGVSGMGWWQCHLMLYIAHFIAFQDCYGRSFLVVQVVTEHIVTIRWSIISSHIYWLPQLNGSILSSPPPARWVQSISSILSAKSRVESITTENSNSIHFYKDSSSLMLCSSNESTDWMEHVNDIVYPLIKEETEDEMDADSSDSL